MIWQRRQWRTIEALSQGRAQYCSCYLFIYLFILLESEPSRSPKVIFLKVDWELMLFIILNLVFNYNIEIDNLGKLINKLGHASRWRHRSVKSACLAYTISRFQFWAQNSWPFHTFNHHLFLTSICFRWLDWGIKIYKKKGIQNTPFPFLSLIDLIFFLFGEGIHYQIHDSLFNLTLMSLGAPTRQNGKQEVWGRSRHNKGIELLKRKQEY